MQRKYYTDQELEKILTQSDDEEIVYIPDEADTWEDENNFNTPQPTYIPTDSSDSSNSSETDFSDDQQPTTSTYTKNSKQKTKKKNIEEFIWKQEDFNPIIYRFESNISGCATMTNLTTSSSALDFFQLYFNEDIMGYIAEQSNMCYKYLKSQNVPDKSRLRRWKDVDVSEMYCFIAVNLLMGRVRKICT